VPRHRGKGCAERQQEWGTEVEEGQPQRKYRPARTPPERRVRVAATARARARRDLTELVTGLEPATSRLTAGRSAT
jgi:hypothetical protein